MTCTGTATGLPIRNHCQQKCTPAAKHDGRSVPPLGLAFSNSPSQAGIRPGAALVFASSAGHDVHTLPGLSPLAGFGFELSFIPHWNNAEGGEELDTNRRFIGRERSPTWSRDLPRGIAAVGLDEHTWLILD